MNTIKKIINTILEKFIYVIYPKIFWRKIFYNFNLILYKLSLKWIGILNFYDSVSWEKYFINKVLPKYISNTNDQVIFDIGANVWDYSKTIYQTLDKANIYAFEPHPKTFTKLENNFKNKNIKTLNLWLGSETETIKLYDYKNKDWSQLASIYKEVIEWLHKKESLATEIKIITLEDFCKSNNINKIDFIKIDTEGNEKNVILWGIEIIRKTKVIQIEFNEMNVISRTFLKDFYDLLPEFDIYRLLPSWLLPLSEYNSNNEIFKFQNLILINKNI